MIKLNNLEELTEYISGQLELGLSRIRKKYLFKQRHSVGGVLVKDGHLNGWKEMRAIIVANKVNGIRLCERFEKVDGDIEIFKVIKRDIDFNSFQSDKWLKIITKCSLWLEANGFYRKQSRLSDETKEMF